MNRSMLSVHITTRIFLVIIYLLRFTSVLSKDCKTDSYCKCTFDDGTVVDITSLGNKDNTPRFKDVLASSEGNFYSYNPCMPFSEMECSAAAVCILNTDKSQSITIGDAAKAAFKYDDSSGNVIAGYTSGDITNLRLSEIVLECDENACEPEITADGQQQGGFFQMTLKSVCACPNGCTSSGSRHCKKGISGGSIFIIILASSSFLYIVGGVLFMKFVKKKDGVEVFPNVVFWQSLIVNIKGGFTFLLDKFRRKKGTYESI